MANMTNIRRRREWEGSVNSRPIHEDDGVYNGRLYCNVNGIELMVGKRLSFPDLNAAPPQTPPSRPQATLPSIGLVVSSGRRAAQRYGCGLRAPMKGNGVKQKAQEAAVRRFSRFHWFRSSYWTNNGDWVESSRISRNSLASITLSICPDAAALCPGITQR